MILNQEKNKLQKYHLEGILSKEYNLKESSNPYAVIQLQGSYIISFPYESRIGLLNEKLQYRSTVVNVKCYGMAVCSSRNYQIICACETEKMRPNLFEMLLEPSIRYIRSYKTLGNNVRHVTVDENRERICYTDIVDCTVVCIDGESGSQIFKFADYAHLKYPTGISLDSEGNIYVVGCLSKIVL